jgi:hypothetical protein
VQRYGGKKAFGLSCTAASLQIMIGGIIFTRSLHITRMSRADGYGVVVQWHCCRGVVLGVKNLEVQEC